MVFFSSVLIPLVFFNIKQTFGVEYFSPLRAFPEPLTCDQLEEGCPVCDAPARECGNARIRRNWSTLDDSEKERYINALHILKWTSAEDGKSMYGDNFVRYDELILHHAAAENDVRGDQAHLGEHFSLWHRLFILKAENAILSVDPEIGALPYWDHTEGLSAVFGNSSLSFGSTTGTGFNSSVVDGAFANWTVSEYDEYLQNESIARNVSELYEGVFSNATGRTLLRKTDVPTDGIVRYATCDNDDANQNSYTSADFAACVNEPLYINFHWCLESPDTHAIHENSHFWIGSADSTTLGYGCPGFSPPAIEEAGARQGDMLDKSTSVNDPIFFLHHAYTDLIAMEFMRANSDGDNYWSFQSGRNESASVPVDGTMIYDTVNSEWPFYGSDLLDDASAPQGALKFWEVMCWLGPETSLYTYDTYSDSCSDGNSEEEDTSDLMTLSDLAEATPDISLLWAAIQTANLTDFLDSGGEYTVFAPTDDAFSKLDPTLILSLLADQDYLIKVLNYHVLDGIVMSADAPTGIVSTLGDSNLLIVKRNNIRLNEEAKVTTPDVMASNGVVHMIDTVLMPPGNLLEELFANLDRFATIYSVLSMFEDLVTALEMDGPYTVFAPTDSAFKTIAAIIPTLTEEQIYTLCLHHVVDGNVASFDLEVGAEVTMLSGQNVTIGTGERTNVYGEVVTRVTVDGKFIIDYNNMASNGVFHIIEEVLIPSF